MMMTTKRMDMKKMIMQKMATTRITGKTMRRTTKKPKIVETSRKRQMK